MDVSNFKAQIRKGLVEFCLLSLIESKGRAYGLEMIETLGARGMSISEGTLYPLLSRLVREKILSPKWETENTSGHPRKYYELSPSGKQMLSAMANEWDQLNSAILFFRNHRGEKNGRE